MCPTPVAPGLVIASVDPDQTTLRGASVTVDDFYSPDEDVVEYGPLPAGVTAAFDAANGELTFTGEASLADYQALLRSVTYRNTNPGPVNPEGGLPTVTYRCGSIENSRIRKVVCEILEGGEQAFLDRERRYRLQRNHQSDD